MAGKAQLQSSKVRGGGTGRVAPDNAAGWRVSKCLGEVGLMSHVEGTTRTDRQTVQARAILEHKRIERCNRKEERRPATRGWSING